MIAGALEGISFAGFEVARFFVFAGLGWMLVIALTLACAPMLSLGLRSDELRLSKSISFAGINIKMLQKNFIKGTLAIKSERRAVFASDTLATQESSKLIITTGEESQKVVVSDIERIMFSVDLNAWINC